MHSQFTQRKDKIFAPRPINYVLKDPTANPRSQKFHLFFSNINRIAL
jgi:hypothetical protein